MIRRGWRAKRIKKGINISVKLKNGKLSFSPNDKKLFSKIGANLGNDKARNEIQEGYESGLKLFEKI